MHANSAAGWPAARRTILLVGLGGLGSRILDGLVRSSNRFDLVVGGRDEQRIQFRSNLAVLGHQQVSGRVADVRCVGMDLADIDATAGTLAALRPELVVNCATLQPYSLIAALAPQQRQRLSEVGLGPWLPAHLALADRLMQAVERSGQPIGVVNCAYPDAVNPALAAVGRAPLVGIGNVANNEPALRRAIADVTGSEPADVAVRMVMHHYVSHRIHRLGDAGGAPFHLSFSVGTRDLTGEIEAERLFGLLATRYRREHGEAGKLMPAASAVALVSGLFDDTVRQLHAPGPLGLIGGFPVEVSRTRLVVIPPPGLTLAASARINAAAQQFDGIEEIGADGTVSFTDEAVAVVADILGHTCRRFHVTEAMEWTRELTARCAERTQS